MLEIFKSHRRTYKNVTASKDQNVFASVMVEVYKEYIKDRMKLPENANYCDLAFKMCQQEMNYRKNLEKGIVGPNPSAIPAQAQPLPLATTSSPILNIKSVSEINKSVVGCSSSNIQTTTPQNNNNNNNKPQSSTSSSPSPRTKPRASGGKSSSNATSQQWLNSLMMSLYSNPSMMTSSYLSEYYKMLGVSSSGFSAQQLALLSDPNFAATLMAGTSSGNASPTSSSPVLSPLSSSIAKTVDTKLIESLMKSSYGSNSLQGLQQNLISNSLSITTTTITSTTTTSSSSSKAQTTMSNSSRKSDVKNPMRRSLSNTPSSSSPSSSKSDLNSSGLSTKYSSLFGSNINIPDLPKSLSITPSMPASSSSSTASNSAKANEKKSLKEKSSTSALGKFNLNPSLSITSEGYKASTSMFKSYEEFLKSYPSTHQGIIATSKKSSPVAVSGMSSPVTKQKQKSNLQIVSSQHVPPKAKTSAKVPYDFGKNIASSFMPTASTSPFSLLTPPLAPPSPHTSSSPKTLQQKLAERKQQNQQPKSSAKKSSKINYKPQLLD